MKRWKSTQRFTVGGNRENKKPKATHPQNDGGKDCLPDPHQNPLRQWLHSVLPQPENHLPGDLLLVTTSFWGAVAALRLSIEPTYINVLKEKYFMHKWVLWCFRGQPSAHSRPQQKTLVYAFVRCKTDRIGVDELKDFDSRDRSPI